MKNIQSNSGKARRLVAILAAAAMLAAPHAAHHRLTRHVLLIHSVQKHKQNVFRANHGIKYVWFSIKSRQILLMCVVCVIFVAYFEHLSPKDPKTKNKS